MNALRRPSWFRWWAVRLLVLGLACAPLFGQASRTAAPSANDLLAQAVATSICSVDSAPTAEAHLSGERGKHCLSPCMGLCAALPASWAGLTVATESARGALSVSGRARPAWGASSLRLPLSRAPPAISI
ncbi:MAG: hypothetical protein R3E56_14365 [Burkholderiaceae bacterium]